MAKEKRRYSIDAGIEEAENGFIVRVSNNDGPGPSKRFVATSQQEAQSLLKDALDGKIKPKAHDRKKLTTDGPRLGGKGKRGKAKGKKPTAKKRA